MQMIHSLSALSGRVIPTLALALVLSVSTSGCGKKPATEDRATADSTAARHTVSTQRIVMETARTSRLYTSEYVIHKVVTHSDVPSIEGSVIGIPVKMRTRLGDRKVAIPISLTLKAYIDFSSFSEANVERTADGGIVLTLPDPQVVATASRVDHGATRQFIDLTRSRYTDAEIADFARQGADSIESHIGQLDIVEQAQRSAAQTLVPMLRRMGFKDDQITIRFRRDLTNVKILQTLHRS